MLNKAIRLPNGFPNPPYMMPVGGIISPYLDQGEFYSEYGDYEVRINLPSNYVVMGTGNVMEESENQWMLEKSKENIQVDPR